MDLFVLYLEEGFRHILDPYGYDHILFVSTLCALYSIKEWKPLFILITAFTLGHSVTLALATLNIISISSYWVELLIPISILLTGISNFYFELDKKKQFPAYIFRYIMALFFGLIHGLGFSNFLRSMLSQEENLFWPLLAFNVGLESGQLVVVLALLIISFLIAYGKQKGERIWRISLSVLAIIVALKLIFERI